MSSFKKILVLMGVIALLLCILAFGTLDYEVSKALINKQSSFAEFFNRFGELPVGLGLLISTAILFGSRQKEKKVNNVLGLIVGVPFMALFSFFTVIMPINYTYEHVETGIPQFMMIVMIVMAILLFVITLLVINKVGAKQLRNYRSIAFVLILVSFGAVIFVNILKIIWARPRMRSIDTIDQFKYWYQINGPTFDNELKSFPSGHTANAFVMIVYSMFIKNPKYKRYFVTFAITWGSLVALSRVILGAHFLSDVVIGGFITILLFYILETRLMKKKDHQSHVRQSQYGDTIRTN